MNFFYFSLQSFLLCISFLNISWAEENYERVYLATFPRSGNTWTRFLVEEATYIATAAIFNESLGAVILMSEPQVVYCPPTGCIGCCCLPQVNEPVLIKTHFPVIPNDGFQARSTDKVIRIVRHPVDSIYSFYIFMRNYLINKDGFTDTIPFDLLQQYILMWRSFDDYWIAQPNVLTIRYEDLYEHPHHYLEVILSAIGYKFSEEDIERAVRVHSPAGGLLRHFKKYTPEQIQFIKNELNDLLIKYNYSLPNN